MFIDKFFKRKKIRNIKADTLYSVAKDIFREQEELSDTIDVPYFLKAYKFTTDVIKNGELNQKFNMLFSRGKNV